jgi:hypothetical protein
MIRPYYELDAVLERRQGSIVASFHLFRSSTSRYIVLGEVTHGAIDERMTDTHPGFATAFVSKHKSRCTTMCFLYAEGVSTRVKLRERALSFCTRVAAPPRTSRKTILSEKARRRLTHLKTIGSKPGHFSLGARSNFSIRSAPRREELCGRSKVSALAHRGSTYAGREEDTMRFTSRISAKRRGASSGGRRGHAISWVIIFPGLECPAMESDLGVWEVRKAEDISRGSMICALEEEEMWKGGRGGVLGRSGFI